MSEPLRFNDIKYLLRRLDAPIISSKPLHLELIVQMEGKTVLVYYLNQKTFQKLTYNESKYQYIPI